jgi:alpha-D-ribose 1-methylphosphonate 5-phosphate C-P lyase
MERAAGPSPMTMSSWKSSMAGYSTSSTTGRQTMDLVHEQHIPGFQVGQQGRQITGALQHGTGAVAQVHAQFVGDDV